MGDRITFGGLATGLDTAALLDAVLTFERRPLELLEQRRTQLQGQQSLMRDFNTKVLALFDAVKEIDTLSFSLTNPALEEEVLAYSVSSSDETVVTATATGAATPGTVEVTVNELAKVSRRISDAFADDQAIIANAGETMTIDYGGTDDIDITIGAGGASLRDLRDAINTDPNNGGNVRAEILFDGTTYRLITSGVETGLANNVTVTTNISGTGGNPFVDAALSTDSSDASIEVLGITVTRESNEMTDVLPGITFKLKGESDPGTTVELNIALDGDAVLEKFQAFTDAYNEVQDFIATQSVFDTETGTSAPLFGNPALRGVQASINAALFGRVTNQTNNDPVTIPLSDGMGGTFLFSDNPFTSFAQIGIRFDGSGRLTIEEETFKEALDDDPLAVREFFGGLETHTIAGVSGPIDVEVAGPLRALGEALTPITQFGDGVLATRIDAFEAQIDTLDSSIRRAEDRLADREEFLIRQFSTLESLISSLQAQASFLGQGF